MWTVHELELNANQSHDWWTFPVQATFTHESGKTVTVNGYWDGGKTYRIRYTLSKPGVWNWTTKSEDTNLNAAKGFIRAITPTDEQYLQNPNYRGHVRIHESGRYFEYADGTPMFMMADTLWSGNSARCGLGKNQDGPFFQYLADRKTKGFTTILMQLMRGFGDTTTEVAGQRNEGGYPFRQSDISDLNPDYFSFLDRRMSALWEGGWFAATPLTWFGKLNCFFSLEWAKRIGAYMMVRYGAYNTLWCLSGEYQFAMESCGWTIDDINAFGTSVQAHNTFNRPMSIHPSGRLTWDPPHNVQSSRVFHESGWLDHHWLQSGQPATHMHHVPARCEENRLLKPTRPVFCSEATYERSPDIQPDGPYFARWQAWVAFLNGACGYAYGAFGVWQFLDLNDPVGETGRIAEGSAPWQEAISYVGSEMLKPVHETLCARAWWLLEPCRQLLQIDGQSCPLPTPNDLSPPHAAWIPGKCAIIYIPRGNDGRTISFLGDLTEGIAQWINPRNGKIIQVDIADEVCLPERPDKDEDWILILE